MSKNDDNKCLVLRGEAVQSELNLEIDYAMVKLNRAYLCQDCDTISGGWRVCEACGSSAVLPLARVLNRSAESTQPDRRSLDAGWERLMRRWRHADDAYYRMWREVERAVHGA